MAAGRVTKAGSYVELGGAGGEQVTKAGSYVELGGAGGEQITTAGFYIEYRDAGHGAFTFDDMTVEGEGTLTSVATGVADITFGNMTVAGVGSVTDATPPLPSTNKRPTFYARLQNPDFSEMLTPPFEFDPVRWGWALPGGCNKAEIEVGGKRRDAWNMLPAMLRSPVKIYNNNHTAVWWGYVHAVELYSDDMTIGISLDGMYNNVAVDYSRLDTGSTSPTADSTTFAQDSDSVTRWGQKSTRVSFGETTAAGADLVRDLYLSRYRYITPDIRSGGSKTLAGKLICRGWWEVLGWKYYSNAGTTATDISDQVAAIVAEQALIAGSDIVATHTTQTNEYRDGTQSARDVIESLLQIPQSPTVSYTATITPERYLRFQQEGQSATTDWLLMQDGQFRTFLNGIPDPGISILGWAQLRGVLPTTEWGYMITPTPLYIEENEFDASSLNYSWRARGANSPWG